MRRCFDLANDQEGTNGETTSSWRFRSHIAELQNEDRHRSRRSYFAKLTERICVIDIQPQLRLNQYRHSTRPGDWYIPRSLSLRVPTVYRCKDAEMRKQSLGCCRRHIYLACLKLDYRRKMNLPQLCCFGTATNKHLFCEYVTPKSVTKSLPNPKKLSSLARIDVMSRKRNHRSRWYGRSRRLATGT